jgi:hypothetical protein
MNTTIPQAFGWQNKKIKKVLDKCTNRCYNKDTKKGGEHGTVGTPLKRGQWKDASCHKKSTTFFVKSIDKARKLWYN